MPLFIICLFKAGISKYINNIYPTVCKGEITESGSNLASWYEMMPEGRFVLDC